MFIRAAKGTRALYQLRMLEHGGVSVSIDRLSLKTCSYLLLSHGSISMFTVTIKKLQFHALLKLDTSLFPQF